jgi:hypothetical protein
MLYSLPNEQMLGTARALLPTPPLAQYNANLMYLAVVH